jgi:5'(3')-deoxyribonucleotidase
MDNGEFILGVDLDGVVGDFYAAMRSICAEWLGKDEAELPAEVGFGLAEWGIKEYGGYERLHRFAVTQRDLFRVMKPIHEAPATLRRLSTLGVRIRIITHRLFLKYSHKDTITQTVDWLDYHDVPYWDICFMKDKGAVGAHLYIDDAPQNVLALRQSGAEAIVFTNSTNRSLPGPRADSWSDVYRMTLDVRDEWRTGMRNIFTV